LIFAATYTDFRSTISTISTTSLQLSTISSSPAETKLKPTTDKNEDFEYTAIVVGSNVGVIVAVILTALVFRFCCFKSARMKTIKSKKVGRSSLLQTHQGTGILVQSNRSESNNTNTISNPINTKTALINIITSNSCQTNLQTILNPSTESRHSIHQYSQPEFLPTPSDKKDSANDTHYYDVIIPCSSSYENLPDITKKNAKTHYYSEPTLDSSKLDKELDGYVTPCRNDNAMIEVDGYLQPLPDSAIYITLDNNGNDATEQYQHDNAYRNTVDLATGQFSQKNKSH